MLQIKKLPGLLLFEQRRRAVRLLILMFIGMILETLGVGLVVPAIALMIQKDLPTRYPELNPIFSALGNPPYAELAILGMLALVGVYTLKVVFLGYLGWQQARFAHEVQISLSERLFNGYIKQPYIFHLQRNSAQMIRNTINEVRNLTLTLQQSLVLVTELLVLVGVSLLLIIMEPVGAILVIVTLGLSGWLFQLLTRGHVLRWGTARQYHDGLRIQHLQQGLGGVKDVKLLGREAQFLAKYTAHNVMSGRMSERQATLQAFPRLWLELLAIVGLACLVISLILQGRTIDTLVPTLGMFAAAAFRFIPSVNRVLTALQQLRFGLPIINSLHSELRSFDAVDDAAEIQTTRKELSFKQALVLDHVTYQYPSSESPAVREVSLTIPAGTSVGFIGGSGAGKSTLVDVILGLLTPMSGQICVDGVDIQTHLRDWQNLIGYVPQSIFLTDDTLRCNVAFGIPDDQINDEALWQAIRAAQLENYVNELPKGLDTIVGERGVRLSGGQRQRIGIARALYHDPAVLVLDEATSSLDNATEREVMEAVRDLHGKKTVLIVAHRLSTIEQCDYIYELKSGQIVSAGPPSSILQLRQERVVE